MLKDFYSVLKSTSAEHIHWCFLTDISTYYATAIETISQKPNCILSKKVVLFAHDALRDT